MSFSDIVDRQGHTFTGDVIAMMSWRTSQVAEAFERRLVLKEGVRFRRVRVVRDYGMFDRREATQYYPAISRTSDTPQSSERHGVNISSSDTDHS